MTASQIYMLTGTMYIAPTVPTPVALVLGLCLIIVSWLVKDKE